MKYLLDTHAIIWMIDNSPEMSSTMLKIINNSENSIGVSVASLWEIAIKMSIGKLKLSVAFDEAISEIRKGRFVFLQIEDEHLHKLTNLQTLHKDPFDRLLISTALAEGMTIITADENIQKYGVSWIW